MLKSPAAQALEDLDGGSSLLRRTLRHAPLPSADDATTAMAEVRAMIAAAAAASEQPLTAAHFKRQLREQEQTDGRAYKERKGEHTQRIDQG